MDMRLGFAERQVSRWGCDPAYGEKLPDRSSPPRRALVRVDAGLVGQACPKDCLTKRDVSCDGHGFNLSPNGDEIPLNPPFIKGDKRGIKILFPKHRDNVRQAKSPLVTWAESFIFAGSSAFLLHVANLFPEYWYVSFFALTPFLFRIIKASPRESLHLGFLFGLSFFAVLAIDYQTNSPLPSLLKLLSGTGLFALFGWTVGWASRRWRNWGFNPFIIALLWVGLEIGLLKLGFIGVLLGEAVRQPPVWAEFSHPFFGGMVALFGFLTVSAIIVLLNSLLVLVILKTLAIKRPRGKTVQEDERTWGVLSTLGFSPKKIYLVPQGRAPPCIITGASSFMAC
jgi:hypothetical protein